jgi:hypothetical protein
LVYRAVLLALVFAGLAVSSLAAEPAGRVCLASAPTPTPGPKSLGNPAGDLADATYSIRINGDAPVELSRAAGVWSAPLAVGVRHTVIVARDGEQIESFHFRLNTGEPTELCLFMKSLYQTWILEPLQASGTWSSCGPLPRAPAG